MVLHVVNDAHFFPRLIDYGERTELCQLCLKPHAYATMMNLLTSSLLIFVNGKSLS